MNKQYILISWIKEGGNIQSYINAMDDKTQLNISMYNQLFAYTKQELIEIKNLTRYD